MNSLHLASRIIAMINRAMAHLSALDKDWHALVQEVGACNLNNHEKREPYEALVRAVAYQQLHPKAGDAILERTLNLFDDQFPSPQALLATENLLLSACGFSARKVETIKGIATARLAGVVPDLQTALSMDNETLIAQLTTIKGIGRWTVEMMLIFSLGRLDVLPVDDFGVCDGYRRLKNLLTVPKPKEMHAIGLAWQPYRSIAAWYLWRVPKTPIKTPTKTEVKGLKPTITIANTIA